MLYQLSLLLSCLRFSLDAVHEPWTRPTWGRSQSVAVPLWVACHVSMWHAVHHTLPCHF